MNCRLCVLLFFALMNCSFAAKRSQQQNDFDEVQRKILHRNETVQAQIFKYTNYLAVYDKNAQSKNHVRNSKCLSCKKLFANNSQVFNFDGKLQAAKEKQKHWMHVTCALSLEIFACPSCPNEMALEFNNEAMQKLVDPKEVAANFEVVNLSRISIEKLQSSALLLAIECTQSDKEEALVRFVNFLDVLNCDLQSFFEMIVCILKGLFVAKKELFLSKWIIKNRPEWIIKVAMELIDNCAVANWIKCGIAKSLPAYDALSACNEKAKFCEVSVATYWVFWGRLYFASKQQKKMLELLRKFKERFGVKQDFESANSELKKTTLMYLELCVRVRFKDAFDAASCFVCWEKIPQRTLVEIIKHTPIDVSAVDDPIFCAIFHHITDADTKIALYLRYVGNCDKNTHLEIEFLNKHFSQIEHAAILNQISTLPQKLQTAKALVGGIVYPIYLIFPLTKLAAQNIGDAEVLHLLVEHLRGLGSGVLTPILHGMMLGQHFNAVATILESLNVSDYCASVLMSTSQFVKAPQKLQTAILNGLDFSRDADSHAFVNFFVEKMQVKKTQRFMFVGDDSTNNEAALGPLFGFVEKLPTTNLQMILGRAFADGNQWLVVKIYKILDKEIEKDESFCSMMQFEKFSQNSNIM